MMRRSIGTVAIAVLLFSSIVAGGALGASSSLSTPDENGEMAQAGTHVAFDTSANALANYSVDGTELVSGVQVESRSNAEQRADLGVDIGLSAVTDLVGAALSVNAETDTRVEIDAESGAAMTAHDSQHGHLVVRADEGAQFVGVNVSADAETEQDGDARVVVTHENGSQGTFIVIGEGEVAVNEAGNVTAEIEEGSTLTYRQYAETRSEADAAQEQLIANGTAAAEVYVSMAAEGGSEAAADVVQYSEDTTVEVVTYSENRINLTAERAESEGRVIVTSISEQAIENANNLSVTVDGEAATQVESASELEAAAAGGDNSAYMIRQATTADASTEVLVGVNHFSEREIGMSSADDDGTSTDDGGDSSGDGGDDSSSDSDPDDETDDSGSDGADGDTGSDPLPGFGVALGGIALTIATLLAARKR